MRKIFKIGTFCLLLLALLSGCSFIEKKEIPVYQGKIDLSGLENGSITTLDGRWEYFPDVFLSTGGTAGSRIPDNAVLSDVPSVWKQNPPGQGFGTYRLTMTGLDPEAIYSLYFFEKVSAARYYVNGIYLGSDGTPAVSPDRESPEYIPSLQSFHAQTGEAELMVQISNFNMKNGGFWESVRMGRSSDVQHYWVQNIVIQSLVIGALMFMGVYHFFLFMMRRQNKAPLWLSLVILLIVIKSLNSGEQIMMRLIPGVSQIRLMKLSTLSVTFMIPFFLSFIKYSFPGIMMEIIIRLNYLISGIYMVIILFLQLPMVQTVYPPYLWVIILNLIFLVYIISKAYFLKMPGSGWSFIGTLILLSSGLNDILYELHFIQTAYILNFGFLFFLLFQTLLNAGRDSHAYSELESLRNQLEKKVELRTEELLEERNKLEAIARIDSLTGLYNRNSSHEVFEREIQRFKRYGTGFSVILIDLDHFKKVNDSYGHTIGDTALQTVSREIREISRTSDFCFRWGGEEFLLMLPSTTEENAELFAEKLRLNVASTPVKAKNLTFFLTMSYGISSIKDKNEDIIQILNRADMALYRAKDDGRNRGYVYK